jgi:hypothetical protein
MPLYLVPVDGIAAVPRWVSVRWGLCQAVEEVAMSGTEAEDSGGESAGQRSIGGVQPSLVRGGLGL